MKSFTSMALFSLLFVLAGTFMWPTSADEKRLPDPKRGLVPFVDVGPTIHLYSGIQLNPCQCTTLTGYGMKEVRVALILVRNGDETMVEERAYHWDAWTDKGASSKVDSSDARVQGILQVQLNKGEKRNQFTLAFGAGFEGHAGWDHIRKPQEIVVETNLATTQYTSLRGDKKAGQLHIASIYAIHGTDKAELGDVKSVDDLKRKSKDHMGTTFLVTTVYWSTDK
jgi:hypothetical protein